jgi:hypothetical protein
MKTALALAFALVLLASTGNAGETQSDSFPLPDEVTGPEADQQRGCTLNELAVAGGHCIYYHAPKGNQCLISACHVSGNYVVYSWTGYAVKDF